MNEPSWRRITESSRDLQFAHRTSPGPRLTRRLEERASRRRGPEPTAAERMTQLAQSFPSLRARPGVEPWDATLLEQHAMSGDAGAAEMHACRFLLGLWNPHPKRQWRCGRFDLVKAMATWDDDHRDALRQWVYEPWWP